MSHMTPEPTRTAPADPARWVDAHGDCLFSYAIARVGDRARAEDLVQETLLAALQARHTFAGRCSERTWLVGILKHKIVDHYRRAGRERRVEVREEAAAGEDPFSRAGAWTGHWRADLRPAEWQADPAVLFEQEEFHAVLQRCLAELPQRMARAFLMREVEGMSSEEICKALGISATNLWVMLHRARLQLRRSLETRWFEARRERA